MAEAASTSGPAVAHGDAVRIVLFGMPGAGKSSLLGALAQAAQTQEHLLHGRIEDRSHGLEELQHRLYDEEARRTAEEVVPYPIDFEPFPADAPAAPAHLDAILIDCDGRVANDLLVRRRSLPADSPEGSLASEVLAADTLVLVVDASAAESQVDIDFDEFVRFLRLLERGRGERSEVGGLPVFLVLAKCDLLAQATDAPPAWLARIAEREREVANRFDQFLARRQRDEGPLPFGRIDLHLITTAVKHPALAGIPAKPREPYGVAELFRQCLDAARDFRQRRQRSSRLLLWTVAGAGILVAGMVGLAVALFSGVGRSESRPGSLETRVENYQAADGQSPPERLRGNLQTLEEKIAVLAEIRSSPDFEAMPAKSRDYVDDRSDELRGYVAYFKRLQHGRQPADARSEQELDAIEEALRTRGGDGLAVPRDEWGQTRAARLHDERFEDAKLLRRAVEQAMEAYQQKKREGERLWTLADYLPGPTASINWRGWHADVETYLATIAKPLGLRESDRLLGASSPDLTYQTVYEFENVRRAVAELDGVRKKLQGLRDLTAALALGVPADKAILVFPPGFTAAASAERAQQLRQAFPDFDKTFPDMRLPDAARGDVRQAAETSYKPLLEAGREVVLAHLREASPGGPETPKTWKDIPPWLARPADLSAWNVLARVLLRLADPERVDLDPVADLASFVDRDSFELSLAGLALEVPDGAKVRPDGDLAIYQIDFGSKKEVAIRLAVADKKRDLQRGITTYVLRPKNGSTLTYRPGDDLNAELPVRDADDRPMKLTWARGRSRVYQFEHLTREPRLHARDADPQSGRLDPGIRLSVAAGRGTIPRVPDLVPVVKLDKSK
jgi:GTPase SAR1 family protein